MDLQLAGRTALVTGASRGIGLGIARALAAQGVRVVMTARAAETLQAAAEMVGGIPVVGDVGSDEGAEALHRATVEAAGHPDILVNNVGGRAGTSWDDTGVGEVASAMNLNLYAAVRMTSLCLPAMKAAGWGRVIVISSVWGREAGGAPAYNAAKAAENSFVTSLGREVAGAGVTVNAVAPGSVLFEGGGWWRRREADPEGMAEFVRREMPLGRFGTVEEVADVVAFLASSRASYVNAAVVAVDGGQHRSNL